MREVILVTQRHSEESRLLAELLAEARYQVFVHDSPTVLQNAARSTLCRTLILDLDSLPVDDLFIRRLRSIHPKLCIIFLSSRSFHPELKEAMSRHVCACIKKPLNPDEVLFCLKNLCDLRNQEDL